MTRNELIVFVQGAIGQKNCITLPASAGKRGVKETNFYKSTKKWVKGRMHTRQECEKDQCYPDSRYDTPEDCKKIEYCKHGI